MKGKAILFGLNYHHCESNHLNGCINDVHNMAEYLTNTLGIQCATFTDDTDLEGTSGIGIVKRIYELALDSYREDLDFAFIHYSGHGSYVRDRSGDERDGRDECLVPSDCDTKGYVSDDYLTSVFTRFNPKTRVLCIFDCCHSGTIGDMKYSWEGLENMVVENMNSKVTAKVMTLSGCLDKQTSADFFAQNSGMFAGALTDSLLMLLKTKPELTKNVFKLVDELRVLLKERDFDQIPKLCTSYKLIKDKSFIPSFI